MGRAVPRVRVADSIGEDVAVGEREHVARDDVVERQDAGEQAGDEQDLHDVQRGRAQELLGCRR